MAALKVSCLEHQANLPSVSLRLSVASASDRRMPHQQTPLGCRCAPSTHALLPVQHAKPSRPPSLRKLHASCSFSCGCTPIGNMTFVYASTCYYAIAVVCYPRCNFDYTKYTHALRSACAEIRLRRNPPAPKFTCAEIRSRQNPPEPKSACAEIRLRQSQLAPKSACAEIRLRRNPPAPKSACAEIRLRRNPSAPKPACAETRLCRNPPAP